MSSKKKIKGRKYNNQKKKTEVHYLRNLMVLCIVAVLLGMVTYRSFNVYSAERILEYPAEQNVTGYVVSDNNYTIEDQKEHYIEYTFDQRKLRVLWINLSKEVDVDTYFNVQTFLGDKEIDKTKVGVSASQFAPKVYLSNKNIDRIRISSDQNFMLDSVYLEHLQKANVEGKNSLQIKIVILTIILLGIAFGCAKLKIIEELINKIAYDMNIHKIISWFNKNTRLVCLTLLQYIIAGFLGWVMRNIYVIIRYHGNWLWTAKSFIYGIMLGLLVNELIKYIFIIKKRVFETLYLRCGVILCMGLILLLPMRLNVSWDDQTHFINAVTTSRMHDSMASVAEEDFYYTCYLYQLQDFSRDELPKLKEILNDPLSARTITTEQPIHISYKMLVYLPVVLTFFMARGIGIPLTVMVILGRMAGALFYLIMIYLGMRHLKSGKMIMAVISLMPGAIFLVSNYNYDYWLISLIAYAIAYLIGEYQEAEKFLTTKDVVLIFGSFLIGIIVKPVYIPLLGLAAFLPDKKFKNAKMRKLYRCFFFGIVIIAILGFIILIFGGGLGAGDTRGGSEVSTVGQIQYILSDPAQYMRVLINYLRYEYLNMTMFRSFIVDTAYFWSIPALAVPCLCYLMVVTVIDRYRDVVEKVGCGIKLVVLPLVLITVCCVATALYVTFTEVGATTVKGCQGRYLWPVMIPLFLTAGQIRVLTIPRSKIINRWIETVVMLVSIILAGCMMTEFL